MYKLCKTEQSAARQKELENGLLAIMGQRPYEELSVSDLCDYLQVPRKSFYRYFQNKEGALHALIDHTLMEYELFSRDYRSAGKRILDKELEQFFRFWIVHRPLLDVLARNGLTATLIARCIDYSTEATAMPRRFLTSDNKETQDQVVMFTVCGLMTMVIQWHHKGYIQSPESMAHTAVRLLSQPLFPNIVSLL